MLASSEYDLSFLLERTHKVLEMLLIKRLRRVGVSPEQFSILRALSEEDDVPQNVLAKRMGLAPSHVGRLLERVEKQGLITRLRDPDNLRVQRVLLTDAGRADWRRAQSIRDQCLQEVLQPLLPKEANQLTQLLSSLHYRVNVLEGTIMPGDLVRLLSDLQEQEALRIVRQRLGAGEDPLAILADARKALDIVGERFQSGEYFISDLVYSGDIMTQISNILKPRIQESGSRSQTIGKVLIGTVAGDIHDIGKNVVVFLLEANGFEVKDLGVDVSIETFVEAIKSFQPDIVGLSGLMTTVFDTMKDTIAAIDAAGLREGRKIIIGGGQIDAIVMHHTGADAFANDAGSGVEQCLAWVEG